jgi:2-phosphosulfolactate phosphatase
VPASLEVILAPGELAGLARRDLHDSACVVLDVLRATSTIVTALASGADSVVPVAEIEDAVAVKRRRPEVLLAGERNGLRIGGALSGGVEFDLGNSPREFVPEKVGGRCVVITTTNGTRALRACAGARHVIAASFLNLDATIEWLRARKPSHLVLVCSGTEDEPALEDILAAGALCHELFPDLAGTRISDGAEVARRTYLSFERDPSEAASRSRNGRRLLAIPELRDDVALCFARNRFALVPETGADGALRPASRG